MHLHRHCPTNIILIHPQFMLYIPHPSFPYTYPASAQAPNIDRFAALLPPSSGIVTTVHNVSLAKFCAQYGISKSDEPEEKLEKLEYRPGDWNVERLGEKDWREIAGFTMLGWESFLAAHHHFIAAMKSHAI